MEWTTRTEPRTPRGSTKGEIFAWSDTKDNEWQISFEIAVRQGRRQAVGMHIVASPQNNHGIDTDVIRSLPFAGLLTEYLKHHSTNSHAPSPSAKEKGTKRGSRLDDDILSMVADLYRHAINNGLSPTQHIAKTMSISPSGAAKRIQAARQAEFLKPARKGKSGEQEL